MPFVVTFTKVKHKSSRLEHALLLRLPICIGCAVNDSRYPPIKIDSKKPIFFLYVFADLDVLVFIWQTELFENDTRFLVVGGSGGIEDHFRLC